MVERLRSNDPKHGEPGQGGGQHQQQNEPGRGGQQGTGPAQPHKSDQGGQAGHDKGAGRSGSGKK